MAGRRQPDIVLLQEIKFQDAAFPREAVESHTDGIARLTGGKFAAYFGDGASSSIIGCRARSAIA